MHYAPLEDLIADLEQRLAASPSNDELVNLADELDQAVLVSGDVAMLHGAFLPKEAWTKYAPLLNKLAKRIAKLRSGGATQKTVLKKKMTKTKTKSETLTLIFNASLRDSESKKRVTDPKLLALCHNKREETDWDGIAYGDIPVVPSPVIAVVHYNKTTAKLEMHADLTLEREPSQAEIKTILKLVEKRSFHGWGLSYEFNLPTKLEDYFVQFEAKPTDWKLGSKKKARS